MVCTHLATLLLLDPRAPQFRVNGVADVLMGRGKRVSEWSGNRQFREVVARHREAYAKTERTRKTSVALAVMQEVKDYGGRFLKEEEEGSDRWIIVDDARVLEKICQALREKEYAHRPVSVERNAALAAKRKQRRLEKIAAAAAALPNSKRADNRQKSFDEINRHDEGVDETASEGDQGDVDEEGDSSVADNEAEEVDTVESDDVAGGRQLIVNRTDPRSDDAEETETEDDESDNSTNSPLVVPDPPLPKKPKLSHREALRLERKMVPIDKLKGGSSISVQRSADGGEDQSERKAPPVKNTMGSSPIGGPPTASDLLDQHHTHYLDRLKDFKSKYGHCAVPPVRPGSSDLAYDAKFAEWCSRQRQMHREVRVERSRIGTSSELDRLVMLDALGFVFDERLMKKGELGAARSTASIWKKCDHDHYMDRLKDFKSTHGHCAVPPVLAESGDAANDSKFVEWCICQRQLHREVRVKQSRLAPSSELERLTELDMLSFVFDYDEWHWSTMFQRFVDWKNENHEYRQRQQGIAPFALHVDAGTAMAQSVRSSVDSPETLANLEQARPAALSEDDRYEDAEEGVILDAGTAMAQSARSSADSSEMPANLEQPRPAVLSEDDRYEDAQKRVILSRPFLYPGDELLAWIRDQRKQHREDPSWITRSRMLKFQAMDAQF
jgi:Helicase associated domain